MLNSHLQRLLLINRSNNRGHHVTQVPAHFHEYFIITGYRKPYTTVHQCLKSTIEWNNEVFNIWTHLISALVFGYYLYTELQILSPTVYNTPYLMVIFGAIIYTITSTFAHTFNILSVEARHICFMFDYAALSFYSLMSALSMRAYGFPHRYTDTWLSYSYIPLAAVASVYCTMFSCRSRFVILKSELQFQLLRLSSFVVPFLVCHYPLFYRLLYGQREQLEYEEATISWYILMLAFAALSSFLYSSHIPERFWPGKFDVVGHSHSLFHCTTAIGTYIQIRAVHSDMLHREEHLKDNDWSVLDCWYLIIPIVVNLFIVAAFSFYYCRKKVNVQEGGDIIPNDNNNYIDYGRCKCH